MSKEPIRFADLFKYYRGLPHQMAALQMLGEQIPASLMHRDNEWFKVWSQSGKVQDKPREPELQQDPARLSPTSPFAARLTPHITLGEFALGQEQRRFARQDQVDIAAELAAFLERVRGAFGGKPVIITSGYRPAAINAAAGGASQSEHLYQKGCGAVDFYIDGADINAVQAWCDKNWPYSVGYGAPKGFVHLGIRQGRPRVRWDY